MLFLDEKRHFVVFFAPGRLVEMSNDRGGVGLINTFTTFFVA